MSRYATWIAFFALTGSVWSQDLDSWSGSNERTARFGFGYLDSWRIMYCNTYCKSADTMPYLLNLACAAKCPELYLPHGTTDKMPTSQVPFGESSTAQTGAPGTSVVPMSSTENGAPTTVATTAPGMGDGAATTMATAASGTGNSASTTVATPAPADTESSTTNPPAK